MDLTHPFVRLIIDVGRKNGLLRNQLAYTLASAHYETGQWKWLREIWGPTAAQKRYEGRRDLGNTQRGDGKRFMGRGLIMITGRRNYQDWSHRLGIDLVSYPEKAEKPEIAVRILVEGMKLGTFTGKKLSDYISLQRSDFVNARRIVNGTDKADKIAAIAKQYDSALVKAGYGVVDERKPSPGTEQPEIEKEPSASKSEHVIAIGVTALVGLVVVFWDWLHNLISQIFGG